MTDDLVTITRHKKGYWTYDRCREIASSCKSCSELKRKSLGAYYASLTHGWISSFDWLSIRKPSGYWTYTRCREEASHCSSRAEFARSSPTAYHKSWSHRWLEEFFPDD